MIRGNGNCLKSMESVLTKQDSLQWEGFVKKWINRWVKKLLQVFTEAACSSICLWKHWPDVWVGRRHGHFWDSRRQLVNLCLVVCNEASAHDTVSAHAFTTTTAITPLLLDYQAAQLCYKMQPTVIDALWLVCVTLGHNREICQNGWIDQDAIWGTDSSRSKESRIRWAKYPRERGNFAGHLSVDYKQEGTSSEQSIFSALFCRWQQRCSLLLTVLQHLVVINITLTVTSLLHGSWNQGLHYTEMSYCTHSRRGRCASVTFVTMRRQQH